MNKKTVTYQLHTRRLDREVARHINEESWRYLAQ